MEIISLDKDRVKIYDTFVAKKTTIDEKRTLFEAKNLIKELDDLYILDNLYSFDVPTILDYTSGILTMERCYGNNLELMLRNLKTYKQGVQFTNNILKYFIEKKFYWKDFAPRNILIGNSKIFIMDFERGLTRKGLSNQLYLVDNVYEEYGAFILPENRIYNLEKVFSTNNEKLINFSSISSKRVRTILNKLGYCNLVPISKYILAVKMIVVNEIPYRMENDIIFPILELEDYIKNYGYEKYATKIIGGYDARNKSL